MSAISESEVHIWWLSLASDPQDVERSLDLLSEEEQARARRFHFPRDRRRFVRARAFLRTLLGGYIREDPRRVPLLLSASGKPLMADRSDLHFNLSHCEDRGVVAIAGRPVGIDLERLRDVPDALDIAENLFAPGEARALRGCPAERRSEAFLRCWTRKEAYVKARGDGLLAPLGSFEVTLEDGPPQLVLYQDHSDRKWRLDDIAAGEGWTGALASNMESARLAHRVFPPA